MCKGFCRIFNISLHRIAYFSLVSSDVSSDCEQTTKNRRTYRKPKILIRYQVKFLVFYMFSGFLLFGHNHDFDFLNKIYFSGALCGAPRQQWRCCQLFLGFVLMIPLLNFRLGKESQIGPATLSVHCTVGRRLPQISITEYFF